ARQSRLKGHSHPRAHPSAFSRALGSWFSGFWERKALAPEFALPAKNLIVDAVRRGHGLERSDFEIALEEAAIRCAAKGGRFLVGRGAFVDERVPAGGAFRRTRAGNAWRGALRSRSSALPPSADSRFE